MHCNFSQIATLIEQNAKKDEQIEKLSDLVTTLIAQLNEANARERFSHTWSSGQGNI